MCGKVRQMMYGQISYSSSIAIASRGSKFLINFVRVNSEMCQLSLDVFIRPYVVYVDVKRCHLEVIP